MKVTINRELFLKSIKLCANAIADRTVIPIYSSVKMSIDSGVATFTGGNGNVQVSASCNVVECDESFSICLPPKLLIGTISSMTSEDVSLVSKQADNNTISITISSGRNKYKMTGFPAEYYPVINFADVPSIIVKSHDFQKAFSNASSAVDTKELRETMRGCKMIIKGKEMIIYGISNAFMTRQTIELVGEGNRLDDLIIPAEISGLVNEVTDSGDCHINYDGKVVQISLGGVTIKSVCIFGNYPDFESVAKHTPETVVKFNSAEMMDSLKRLSIYTSNNLVVKMKIKDNEDKKEILVGADDSDLGKAAIEFIEKDVYSDLITEKWYNIRYLSNIFSKLDSDNTVIYMSENNNVPAFIAPDNNVNSIKQLWAIASLDPTRVIIKKD